MDNDYYHSKVPKNILEQRDKYIENRWEEHSQSSYQTAQDAIKFLFLVNSGGAVASLSFLGASKVPDSYFKFSLISFCVGLVFIGFLHSRLTYRTATLFDN